MSKIDELRERAQMLVELEYAECHGIPSWWYLSYADDSGFKGGAYIHSYGPTSAALKSAMNGISPGGEVRMVGPLPDPEEYPDAPFPPPEFRERLLTLEELKGFGDMVRWDGEDA